jgi:hypothetical protein
MKNRQRVSALGSIVSLAVIGLGCNRAESPEEEIGEVQQATWDGPDSTVDVDDDYDAVVSF